MIDLIKEKLVVDDRAEQFVMNGGVNSGLSNGDFALSDDEFPQGRKLRAAAVLVPLVTYNDGLKVLLTRRADHLRKHAGQVSFPGGSIDDTDDTAVAAALREAEEEIGLDKAHVDVTGYLDTYETGTGFCILPVVGFVEPEFNLTIDKGEVADVFEVPLDFLMDPKNHQRHSTVWQGKTRQYYAMPYNDYYIWGATAGMLVNMYKRLFE